MPKIKTKCDLNVERSEQGASAWKRASDWTESETKQWRSARPQAGAVAPAGNRAANQKAYS